MRHSNREDAGSDTRSIGLTYQSSLGTYAHVIFTAPSTWLYSIASTFYPQQYGISVDVHMLVNGEVHFSDTITQMPQSHSFAESVRLRAGQKVNFAVGPNGIPELHAGHTGLEAVVARLRPLKANENGRRCRTEPDQPLLRNVTIESIRGSKGTSQTTGLSVGIRDWSIRQIANPLPLVWF